MDIIHNVMRIYQWSAVSYIYFTHLLEAVNIIEENNIILVMLGRNVCYNDNLT